MPPCQAGMGVVHVTKITLVANHLPGYLNTAADRESRTLQDRWDWQIHPNIFLRINLKWVPLSVDLFALRLTHQLPEYFSWGPDPYAIATDAFLQGRFVMLFPHGASCSRFSQKSVINKQM